jgi:hypothetical protein
LLQSQLKALLAEIAQTKRKAAKVEAVYRPATRRERLAAILPIRLSLKRFRNPSGSRRWHGNGVPHPQYGQRHVDRLQRYTAVAFPSPYRAQIRRGIYRSVAALRAEITSFIEHHNADPKPFR